MLINETSIMGRIHTRTQPCVPRSSKSSPRSLAKGVYLSTKIPSWLGDKHDWLVVFRPTPLKNDGVKVSWDDDIPNWMESHKFHVPNHQPDDKHPKNTSTYWHLAWTSSYRPTILIWPRSAPSDLSGFRWSPHHQLFCWFHCVYKSP